jgi:hypothetical protein
VNDLVGASDFHLHTSPDVRERWYDDMQAARLADEHRMYAIVLKSHWTTTADRAIMAATAANVQVTKIYGGLVLNNSVGGLNPAALEKSLELGAKVIWMPTHDAAFHRVRHGGRGGIRLIESPTSLELRNAAKAVIDMCIEAGAIIATGHIAPNEIAALGRYGQPRGAKIVVTHPEWVPTRVSVAEQKELSEYGIMFERCFIGTTSAAHDWQQPMSSLVEEIRTVGVRYTVLSSDLGIKYGPEPFVGFIEFYDQLQKEGISKQELELMSRENPRRLLDEPRSFL